MITTPRYRIGNDMTILWAINNKDGSPFDLSGKEVHLFMTHRYGREEVKCSVVTLPDGTVNNVIRWDFSGDDQKVLGRYALTASIFTTDDMKLIRKDICEAFDLVGRSCMECEEDGEAVINDGGDLILSSKLDIYRFGIPKINIGTNGNWFIDGVDTGRSAIGGGPGLVTKLYKNEDFGKEFTENSVIDTFNAYAINELEKRITDLESDAYIQLHNMTDVLLGSELVTGQGLVWDGTYWTNQEVATKSDGGINEEFEKVRQILNWFEFDKESQQIHAKYGLYTYGGLAAGGKGKVGRIVLNDHGDVEIRDPQKGESLVYDEETQKWINALIEGGEGGSATLERDITADVAVGNISAGTVFTEGTTVTEIFEQMFSQKITPAKPTVKLHGSPSNVEVGDAIKANLSYTYADGYYKNAKDKNGNSNPKALCKDLEHAFFLDSARLNDEDNGKIDVILEEAKKYTVKVTVKYSASEAEVYTKSGQKYTDLIPGGSAEDEVSFYSCYKWFWGFTDKGAQLTSDVIRNLSFSGYIIPGSQTVNILNAVEKTLGGKDIVIAIPKEYELEKVSDGQLGSPYVSNFKKIDADGSEINCAGDVTHLYNIYKWAKGGSSDGSIKDIVIRLA